MPVPVITTRESELGWWEVENSTSNPELPGRLEDFGPKSNLRNICYSPLILLASAARAKSSFGTIAMEQDAKKTRRGGSWWKLAARLVIVLIAALCFGAFLNWFAATLDRNLRPAGFGRGLVQGALMPMSLPNLLFGRDVEIYSERNTGVSYKLGYTAGVNACGAVFFGFFFWRINRWRRRGDACQEPKP